MLIVILILLVLCLIIAVWRAAEYILTALVDISTNQIRLAYDIEKLKDKLVDENKDIIHEFRIAHVKALLLPPRWFIKSGKENEQHEDKGLKETFRKL